MRTVWCSFVIYEVFTAIPALRGGYADHAGITIGIWIASMAFLVFAFVVMPAVFFKEESRRADARKVLQQILDFVRRSRSQ